MQGPAHGTTVERASLRQRKIAVEVRKGVHLAVAFRNPVKTRSQEIHREKLASFEQALRTAKIACYNLVRVSSIFPPNCQEVSIEQGLTQLQPGQIVHVVMSDTSQCVNMGGSTAGNRGRR